MGMPQRIDDQAAVIDANVAIALCAKETGRLPIVLEQLESYTKQGWSFFAPGVIVAETLFVLCSKLQRGEMTQESHHGAVEQFVVFMRNVQPPPHGDASLIERAEQIRNGYGCSHSADGLYLALTEELSKVGTAELVTFDVGLHRLAATVVPHVSVRLLAF